MFKPVTLVALLLSLNSVAFSQELDLNCPERPADEESATALAGTWFSKGTRLAEEESYAEAFVAFNCSLRMVEHPDTVFNAGQAARLSDNRNMALTMFRRYLAMAPDGHLAAKAEKLIDEIEREIEEEEQAARAEAEALRAAREAAAKPEPEKAEPETAVEEEPGIDRGRALKTTGYISMGLGGAVLVTGALFHGLTLKAKSDAESTSSWADHKDYKSSMETRQVITIVGYAVGAVALGTGISLVALSGGTEDDTRVSFLPGPNGFLLSGTF